MELLSWREFKSHLSNVLLFHVRKQIREGQTTCSKYHIQKPCLWTLHQRSFRLHQGWQTRDKHVLLSLQGRSPSARPSRPSPHSAAEGPARIDRAETYLPSTPYARLATFIAYYLLVPAKDFLFRVTYSLNSAVWAHTAETQPALDSTGLSVLKVGQDPGEHHIERLSSEA